MKKIIAVFACCAVIGCNAKVNDSIKDISDAGPCDSNSEVNVTCGEPPPGCYMTDGSINVCSDGCNFCSCFEGNWACTLMACLDTDASASNCTNPPEGCIVNANSPYTCNIDCNVCSCNQGDWMCTQRACTDQ